MVKGTVSAFEKTSKARLVWELMQNFVEIRQVKAKLKHLISSHTSLRMMKTTFNTSSLCLLLSNFITTPISKFHLFKVKMSRIILRFICICVFTVLSVFAQDISVRILELDFNYVATPNRYGSVTLSVINVGVTGFAEETFSNFSNFRFLLSEKSLSNFLETRAVVSSRSFIRVACSIFVPWIWC